MSSSDQSNLLRDFFDFGDDLILPDKPFELKKKENIDLEQNFDEDFFVGQATPSPSSSSSSASSNVGESSTQKQSSGYKRPSA